MRTKGLDPRGSAAMMQRTKTWIILYALGIAILILSLCQSEPGKPAETPRTPAAVSQRAAVSEMMRP